MTGTSVRTGQSTEDMSFGPMTIRFTDKVLRPRPWTAEQSAWVAELLPSAPPGRVLELCSGAGQIGLLAVTDSDRSLVAVDINPAAGELTEFNAERAGLGERVEVRIGSMDSVLSPDELFAVVVADPPWVPSAEISRFPDDPHGAIDGGTDGLDLARTCLAVIAAHLQPRGFAVLQIGTPAQVDQLRGFLEAERDGLAVLDTRPASTGTGILVLIGRPGS